MAFYNPAFYGLVREIVPKSRSSARTATSRSRAYAAFPLGAAPEGRSSRPSARDRAPLRRRDVRDSALLLSFVRCSRRASDLEFPAELREGWSAFDGNGVGVD